MKLSDKARTALGRVVDKFKSGDLSPLVEVSRLHLPEDAPAARWSFSNRVLAYAQTDSLDCRGYRQWQEAGRQVRKGEHGGFILVPRIVKVKNENGEDEPELRGFMTIPVFGYHQTDGDNDSEFDYSPMELPPLSDVAAALGIEVRWQPTPGCYGSSRPDGSRITMGTHDATTWFHELAHAIHARLAGGLKGGQDAHQETVAEFTATVLMWLYGLGDQTGNAWDYIRYYNDDPLKAILKAMADVERIVDFLVEQVSSEMLPC